MVRRFVMLSRNSLLGISLAAALGLTLVVLSSGGTAVSAHSIGNQAAPPVVAPVVAPVQGVTLSGFQANASPSRQHYTLGTDQCVDNGSIRTARPDERASANGDCTWFGIVPEDGGCYYSAAEPSGAVFTLRVGFCPADHDRANTGNATPDTCGDNGAAEDVAECGRLWREIGSVDPNADGEASGSGRRTR